MFDGKTYLHKDSFPQAFFFGRGEYLYCKGDTTEDEYQCSYGVLEREGMGELYKEAGIPRKLMANLFDGFFCGTGDSPETAAEALRAYLPNYLALPLCK